MASYTVTGPDGQKYDVTAPDDATDEQVIAYVQQNAGKASAMHGTAQHGLKGQGAKLPEDARAFINLAQGPLFGFADEIGGAVAAGVDKLTGRNPGMSFTDLYSRYRDVARGASDSFQKEHPLVAPAAQVAASLPLGGAIRAAEVALPARGAISTMRNAAIIGAGTGALGGAGNAESIGDLPADVAKGAALGGALGGVTSGVGQAMRAGAVNVAARANPRTAESLARERVAAALQRDGRTTGQVAARLSTLGDDAPLAVAGGKNTLDLLDTMATMPGATGERVERAIRTQQAGRADRLRAAAESNLGTGGQRLVDALDSLIERRRTDAAPLYQRLYGTDINADAELARLVGQAQSIGADRIASRIAQARGTPFSLTNVTGPSVGPLGVGQSAGTRVSMRDMDYLKEGLDDLVSKATKPDGAISREGLAVLDLKNRLLANLDRATQTAPGQSLYAQARQAFSGPSALIDAANAGRRAMSMDEVSVQAMTRGMSDSEFAAFRVGAFEALRAKVGTEGGQTQILKMWKEPATADKLRALFPSERAFREFAADVAREARKKALEGVGRGSATASRQARMDDEGAAFLQGALDAGTALKTGNPVTLLSGARNLYGRVVMPEQVRDQIGEMLLTRGPQASGLLGDLSRYVDAEQARRAGLAANAGLLGGVGAGAFNPK